MLKEYKEGGWGACGCMLQQPVAESSHYTQ